MKILFVFGGMPHYLNALLNRMARKAEIVVVTPAKGNATIGQGVKMVEGGSFKQISLPEQKAFYGKAAFPTLWQTVRQEMPDIIVLGWPYFLQLYFERRLRKVIRACGTKIMIREIPFQTPPYGQIRNYFENNPMYDEQMQLLSRGVSFYLRQWLTMHLRKYCYKRAAATLNYSTVAYDILPSYGVPYEKIHITFNTGDTESLLREKETVLAAPPLLPPCPRRILHIGRLVKWKRVDLLIAAMPGLTGRFPDAELVVVGDGPELENLKQQAQELGVEKHVRFTGGVYRPAELGAYMNESTVYVLAGMGGLSINDAMTYGLPVICSVADGTEHDLVTDGINGYFFREGDAGSLTDKIALLFKSPKRCQAMGQESERIIREKVNIDTVCRCFLDAFHAVLS